MHVILKGLNHNNKPLTIKWFVVVKRGDGPHVPTIPSIILTRKIIANELNTPGAMPCVGIVGLEGYMHELEQFLTNEYVIREEYS